MITIGLDIGGTDIKGVVLQSPDKILKESIVPSFAAESPERVRTAVRDLVKDLRAEHRDIHAIGIGCAGSINFEEGKVRNSPNFSGWKNVPLRQWAEQDCSLPVVLENDANCATYAEWKCGAGKGAKNLVLLTFGTGIGGGLILNGDLYRGSTGTGGELGHMSIYANGIQCPCGQRGCFERYCSASAIRKKTGLGARETFQKALTDPLLMKVVDEFLSDLCIALTTLGNVFDPDLIILGGGVGKGLVPYLDRIRTWTNEHAFPAVREHMKIVPQHFGNISGALGAALLAQHRDIKNG